MDVDQLVKDLMKARRATYDKVWQQKTQTEWKKKDYNTIYTLVDDLRDKTLYDFKKQSNLSPKQVASTNDAVVSATANGAAVNIEHSIAVSQLADGVKLTSRAGITPAANYKGSLKEQFGDANVPSTLDLMINGKEISLDVTDTTTLNDVVVKINQSGAGVKASYDATLDRFFLYSEKTGATSAVNFSGTSDTGMDFLFNTLKLGNSGTGLSTLGMVSRNTVADSTATLASLGVTDDLVFNYTVDGGSAQEITVDKDGSVQDMLNAINTKLGAGAATYDSTTKRITIKSVNIDHSYTLEGKDDASKAFLTDTLGMTQLVQNGHDAKVTLDGVELTQASNTFTISGVTYSLKSKSLTDPGTGSLLPVSIAVKPDIEKTIDTIQSFVDTYNAFITTINNELQEDRDRDYMPLTDDQKSDMKESEITTYNNKAKSGLLRNDSTLSSMLNSMRLSFAMPIKGLTGKYTSASSIGIETGKYIDSDGNINSESNNGGKIYVDEVELRKALEEDPDAVYKIFGTSSENIESTDSESKGIAGRLYDQLYNSRDQLKTVAGSPNAIDTKSNLAKRLTGYTERLNAMNDQLETIQARYYRQFDAMETAISRMNQQSSWLSQQLGQS
jgi:flagellar hook-associated protein 2